jgi:hypothetical protein
MLKLVDDTKMAFIGCRWVSVMRGFAIYVIGLLISLQELGKTVMGLRLII